MKTLKFKAFRKVIKTREWCASLDGEYKLITIFKGFLIFEGTMVTLLIVG